ncbi:MAG: class I poly(R)-hydroxyalkanoic acid synthase, partial [Stellaceae bacterium]
HIAGVVNPPPKTKYGHWTNENLPPDPEDWFAGATYSPDSWWPIWEAWIAPFGGERVPARKPGGGRLKAIEDAPGSYVRVKASE